MSKRRKLVASCRQDEGDEGDRKPPYKTENLDESERTWTCTLKHCRTSGSDKIENKLFMLAFVEKPPYEIPPFKIYNENCNVCSKSKIFKIMMAISPASGLSPSEQDYFLRKCYFLNLTIFQACQLLEGDHDPRAKKKKLSSICQNLEKYKIEWIEGGCVAMLAGDHRIISHIDEGFSNGKQVKSNKAKKNETRTETPDLNKLDPFIAGIETYFQFIMCPFSWLSRPDGTRLSLDELLNNVRLRNESLRQDEQNWPLIQLGQRRLAELHWRADVDSLDANVKTALALFPDTRKHVPPSKTLQLTEYQIKKLEDVKRQEPLDDDKKHILAFFFHKFKGKPLGLNAKKISTEFAIDYEKMMGWFDNQINYQEQGRACKIDLDEPFNEPPDINWDDFKFDMEKIQRLEEKAKKKQHWTDGLFDTP